jgi:hypothetical protein
MKLARDGGSTEYVSDPDLTWPVTVAPPEHDQGVWRDAVVCERFGVQACVCVGACVWWGYVYMFEGKCARVCERVRVHESSGLWLPHACVCDARACERSHLELPA